MLTHPKLPLRDLVLEALWQAVPSCARRPFFSDHWRTFPSLLTETNSSGGLRWSQVARNCCRLSIEQVPHELVMCPVMWWRRNHHHHHHPLPFSWHIGPDSPPAVTSCSHFRDDPCMAQVALWWWKVPNLVRCRPRLKISKPVGSVLDLFMLGIWERERYIYIYIYLCIDMYIYTDSNT